jgi:hypothetical protein
MKYCAELSPFFAVFTKRGKKNWGSEMPGTPSDPENSTIQVDKFRAILNVYGGGVGLSLKEEPENQGIREDTLFV